MFMAKAHTPPKPRGKDRIQTFSANVRFQPIKRYIVETLCYNNKIVFSVEDAKNTVIMKYSN